jgi:hypothetical protein
MIASLGLDINTIIAPFLVDFNIEKALCSSDGINWTLKYKKWSIDNCWQYSSTPEQWRALRQYSPFPTYKLIEFIAADFVEALDEFNPPLWYVLSTAVHLGSLQIVERFLPRMDQPERLTNYISTVRMAEWFYGHRIPIDERAVYYAVLTGNSDLCYTLSGMVEVSFQGWTDILEMLFNQLVNYEDFEDDWLEHISEQDLDIVNAASLIAPFWIEQMIVDDWSRRVIMYLVEQWLW